MSPLFVDAHAHLNFAAFGADREAAAKRALDAGVFVVNVGTQADTSRAAVALAEKYEHGIYAIVGVHPVHTSKSFHDAKELGEGGKEFTSRGETFDYEYYRKLAMHRQVVGIGECGLDYYRIENDELRIKQEETFRKHIELAIEVQKPLMLHVRNGSGHSAYRDALRLLSTFNFKLSTGRRPGNFHFFAGSWEEAKEILDAGYNLSFTGVITFAREYDEVIRNAPLDRIMSETDCPYVLPEPYRSLSRQKGGRPRRDALRPRGERNEPLYVREVVKKIAEIRGEPFERVREQLAQNALRLFGLNRDS